MPEQIVRTTAAAAGLRCALVRLPDAVALAQAVVIISAGKPFSVDNYKSLTIDVFATRTVVRGWDRAAADAGGVTDLPGRDFPSAPARAALTYRRCRMARGWLRKARGPRHRTAADHPLLGQQALDPAHTDSTSRPMRVRVLSPSFNHES